MHDIGKPDVLGLEIVAYEQHGYFDTRQARTHGASAQLLAHYVRRGRYERVRRGLYRLKGFPVDEYDEMRRQWMAVGRETAVLSHESALAVYELSDHIPDAVHLLVPRRSRGLRRPPGVVIHTRSDDEPVAVARRSGLPLTTPARTLMDVCGTLQPEQWAMAVRQAVDRGLVTIPQIEAERGRNVRSVKAAIASMAEPA